MEEFYSKIDGYYQEGVLDKHHTQVLKKFFCSYEAALAFHGIDVTCSILDTFYKYLDLLVLNLKSPFVFEPYHQRILKPINYHQFGLEFFRPLIEKKSSEYVGAKNIEKMIKQIENGENVILFANHQTESDPQAINLLCEDSFSDFAANMIFVAGERVTADPLAIPFSKGCNLICIYSKKHINNPPELKQKKQMHNKRTMQMMSTLLGQGGKCIYVAPSGGRDRPNEEGEFEVTPFDPQSIEMFYLMAKRSGIPTYFYTLSLLTYNLFPPPDTVEIELGEKRTAKRVGIYAYFSEEYDMDAFPGCDPTNKLNQRHARGEYLWKQVNDHYQTLKEIAMKYVS